MYSALKGFTLIEMMVSVMLLTIVTGAAIVGVITFNQNQGIEDDAKQLISEIRRVYSRATGIYYPPSCTGRLTGYLMDLVNGSNDISTAALCSLEISETRTDVLKSSHFTGADTITINAGDGRIAGSPITIVITSDTSTTLTKSVVVNDFGVIEEL